jgi:hypothetical protein
MGVRSQFEKIDGLDSYLGHLVSPTDVALIFAELFASLDVR